MCCTVYLHPRWRVSFHSQKDGHLIQRLGHLASTTRCTCTLGIACIPAALALEPGVCEHTIRDERYSSDGCLAHRPNTSDFRPSSSARENKQRRHSIMTLSRSASNRSWLPVPMPCQVLACSFARHSRIAYSLSLSLSQPMQLESLARTSWLVLLLLNI